MEKSLRQKVLISQDRKFEIPQVIYTQLNFSDEAECLVVNGNLVLKPIVKETKLSECLQQIREKYAELSDTEDNCLDSIWEIVKSKQQNSFQKTIREIFGDD